jgi:glycosyltransferase involved in cell wall biosynthesis
MLKPNRFQSSKSANHKEIRSNVENFNKFLEAIPLLQKSVTRLRIIIAGSGNDLASYHDLMSHLPCVELRDNFIPTEEAARLFSEADILALPYTEASQSGVLMMAMAFGLAVVASDVGELGNTVKETGMGLLVPPGNEVALAEAIGEIACNTDLRSRLSENAAAALAGPFSRRSLSNRALSIYNALLESRRPHEFLDEESCLIQAPATLKNGPNKE